MAKSLNKVQIIGNLTRDPELKYISSGRGVTSFSVATSRQWNEPSGQQKEEVTYHRVVAWGKLAEICSKYLKKGSRVYVEGRLSNQEWTDKQGVKRTTVQIVVNDLIMLSSGGSNTVQKAKEIFSEPDPAPEPTPEDDVENEEIPF